jgi:hypothetical protein
MEFSYALYSNETLHTLGFSGTFVGKKGVESLIKVLGTNMVLRCVWMMQCQRCSLQDRGKLQMALQHDRGIIRCTYTIFIHLFSVQD